MTGDRVTRIRERVEMPNGKLRMHMLSASDLAYLLAELEGLRAKLANVEEAVARYDDGCPGSDECCAEPLADALRAALHPNQEEEPCHEIV
jgi:hypothetical protein